MFSVVIIDDEIYITALIEQLVDWKALNMSVTGKADNGIAALDLISDLKPDIAIVDVKMPGYDGITLIQKCREKNLNVKFIVISGHKNFEYAQSAIKYNVEDYLLKPISKKELEKILGKLKSKLESEQADQAKLSKIDGELHLRQNKIRSYFTKEIIHENADVLSGSIEKTNRDYDLHFKPDVFFAVIMKFDFGEKDFSRIFLSQLLQKSAEDFSHFIGPYCHDCLEEPVLTSVVFFLNYSKASFSALKSVLSKAFLHIRADLQKFKNVSVTFCCGSRQNSLSGLADSLRHAQKSMKSRIALGMNKIIYYSDLAKKYKELGSSVTLPDAASKDLKAAILNLDKEKIALLVHRIFQDCSDGAENDPLLSFGICDRIFLLFFDCIAEFRPQEVDRAYLYAQFEASLDTSTNQRELVSALLRFIERTENSYVADSNLEENPSVRIAKKYVSENYKKPITLSSVSRVVNLNPVYFSYIFKKETGVTFVDYTNQYRVRIAKDLLRHTLYNISEVAFLSGFNRPRYFSKIFQKVVGITPSDYKSRHTS